MALLLPIVETMARPKILLLSGTPEVAQPLDHAPRRRRRRSPHGRRRRRSVPAGLRRRLRHHRHRARPAGRRRSDLYMALQNTWPELTRRMIFVCADPTDAIRGFAASAGVPLVGLPSDAAEIEVALRMLPAHTPFLRLSRVRVVALRAMQIVRIGHSPDPDDAFMFYALTAGKVKIPGVQIEHLLEDIESLNRRARTARARGHRGVRGDLRARRRPLPDDGSRRVDGEGLRPDPRRARADRSEGHSQQGRRDPRQPHDRVAAAPHVRARGAGADRGGVRQDPAGRARRAGRPRPPDPRGPDHARRRWAS